MILKDSYWYMYKKINHSHPTKNYYKTFHLDGMELPKMEFWDFRFPVKWTACFLWRCAIHHPAITIIYTVLWVKLFWHGIVWNLVVFRSKSMVPFFLCLLAFIHFEKILNFWLAGFLIIININNLHVLQNMTLLICSLLI